MSNTLLLRFAQEELVYLLRALQIGKFPGLQEKPLGNLDADHQSLALAVADRTLQARGIVIGEGSQERRVDPVAAGLLRDCAHPTYTLLADVIRSKQVYNRYLYTFSTYSAIEHSLVNPGIHCFISTSSRTETIERVSAALHLEANDEVTFDAGTNSESYRISMSSERLNAARVALSTDPGKAAQLLASELPDEIAGDLIAVISEPRLTLSLALWLGIPDETKNRVPETTLSMLQGETKLFLLQQEQQFRASHLTITLATMQQAWYAIKTLLAPALEIVPGQ